jgi:hypothetical protein
LTYLQATTATTKAMRLVPMRHHTLIGPLYNTLDFSLTRLRQFSIPAETGRLQPVRSPAPSVRPGRSSSA